MKKRFVFVLIFFSSIVSFGQLESVINDIIRYKSASKLVGRTVEADSLLDLHLLQIKQLANQTDLERIIDTTQSIDLKYIAARTLVNYPSDKISDVFFAILLDSNNEPCYMCKGQYTFYCNCCTLLKWTPYFSTLVKLKDSTISTELKSKLKAELLEMDSISILYLDLFEENLDVMDEIMRDTIKYRIKTDNPEGYAWMSKKYFDTYIKNLKGTYYGWSMGGPRLRSYFYDAMKRLDTINLEDEYREVYYFNLWLNSDNIITQVYGAEALIRLQNRGVVLSEEQIKKINRLKRSNKKIDTLDGCLMSRKPIRKALKPFDFK